MQSLRFLRSRGALALAQRSFVGCGPRPLSAVAAASNDRMASARSQYVVLSLSGADRVGIVRGFTDLALKHGANVEETRMARLGGEFCIIGMLSVPAATVVSTLSSSFENAFPEFHVSCRKTSSPEDSVSVAHPEGQQLWEIELEGPDSLGIVSAVTEALAKTGSNIQSMETEKTQAPFAGFELFKLRTQFAVDPAHVDNVAKAMTSVEEKFGLSVHMAKKDDRDEPPNAA